MFQLVFKVDGQTVGTETLDIDVQFVNQYADVSLGGQTQYNVTTDRNFNGALQNVSILAVYKLIIFAYCCESENKNYVNQRLV